MSSMKYLNDCMFACILGNRFSIRFVRKKFSIRTFLDLISQYFSWIFDQYFINNVLTDSSSQHFWNCHFQNMFVTMTTIFFLWNMNLFWITHPTRYLIGYVIQKRYKILKKNSSITKSKLLPIYVWYEYHGP